jgi:hypothetical protein
MINQLGCEQNRPQDDCEGEHSKRDDNAKKSFLFSAHLNHAMIKPPGIPAGPGFEWLPSGPRASAVCPPTPGKTVKVVPSGLYL